MKPIYISVMCVSCSKWIKIAVTDDDYKDYVMGYEIAMLEGECECGCTQLVQVTRETK